MRRNVLKSALKFFSNLKKEHYGSFICCEYGTRMNFENMSNFAIPLVILTWHRKLQEYFRKNSDKLFFHFGHYSAQNKRNTKHLLHNLHLINSIELETKITSFEMIRPNSDADVCKEACPSLLEWANYLLEPYADLESKENREVNSDNNQKEPMLSYKITDDEIKWKKEPATETTQVNASTPIIGESCFDVQYCKCFEGMSFKV